MIFKFLLAKHQNLLANAFSCLVCPLNLNIQVSSEVLNNSVTMMI